MAGKTLYDKLWDSHVVRTENDGTTLLYIDRHLVHEVTSPQAFDGLRLAGRELAPEDAETGAPVDGDAEQFAVHGQKPQRFSITGEE